MSRAGWLSVWVTCFIISALFFYKYDKIAFRNGLGCMLCKGDLPYNFKPSYSPGYPTTFVFLDNQDMECIGSGFKFNNLNFEINKIAGYAYHDSEIIFKVYDKQQNVKYLSPFIKGEVAANKESDYILDVREITEQDFLDFDKDYWVALDSVKSSWIGFIRALTVISTVICFFNILKHRCAGKNVPFST